MHTYKDIPIDLYLEIAKRLDVERLEILLETAPMFRFIGKMPLMVQYKKFGYYSPQIYKNGCFDLFRHILKHQIIIASNIQTYNFRDACISGNYAMVDYLIEHKYVIGFDKITAALNVACGIYKDSDIARCEYLVSKYGADPNKVEIFPNLSTFKDILGLEWLRVKRTDPFNLKLEGVISYHLKKGSWQFIKFAVDVSDFNLVEFTKKVLSRLAGLPPYEFNLFEYIMFLRMYYPEVIITIGWEQFFNFAVLKNNHLSVIAIFQELALNTDVLSTSSWNTDNILRSVISSGNVFIMTMVLDYFGYDILKTCNREILETNLAKSGIQMVFYLVKVLGFSVEKILDLADKAEKLHNENVAKVLRAMYVYIPATRI